MGKFLDKMWEAFDRHKLMRRLLVVWACGLITWVCIHVFTDIPHLTDAVAHAYEITTAILGVVIGFYKWTRYKEDKQNEPPGDS